MLLPTLNRIDLLDIPEELRKDLDFVFVDLKLTAIDVIGLGIAAVMIVLLVARAARNLRELAAKEPAAPRR